MLALAKMYEAANMALALSLSRHALLALAYNRTMQFLLS